MTQVLRGSPEPARARQHRQDRQDRPTTDRDSQYPVELTRTGQSRSESVKARQAPTRARQSPEEIDDIGRVRQSQLGSSRTNRSSPELIDTRQIYVGEIWRFWMRGAWRRRVGAASNHLKNGESPSKPTIVYQGPLEPAKAHQSPPQLVRAHQSLSELTKARQSRQKLIKDYQSSSEPARAHQSHSYIRTDSAG